MPDTPTLASTPTPSAAPAVAPVPAQQAAPTASKPVTPGSKEWAQMTPEQRHAHLRGSENPRARGHSPARDQREAAEAAAPASSDRPAAADPEVPAHSTEKLKVGKYEVSEADLATMLDRQSQDDLKKLTLPASPELYEAKLPADLKLPGNVEYKFDQSNPSLVAARNWAHAKGLSQDEFSQVLGIYASHEAAQNAALAERSRQEILKAGVTAPMRVDAVSKFITGEMGTADAKPIIATLVTDSHLRFYEKIMQKISSQGAASFSQSHRAAPETNAIPGYDKMSFEQRRHAQDQNAARRR
jgi:hypothetical protein